MFFGIQNTLSKGEKIKVTFNFLEKAQIVSKDIIFEVR
jgi:copper(I)-binding protein